MKKLISYLVVFVAGTLAINMAFASYSPSSEASYGEMYVDDNAVATTIDTANVTHMLNGIFTTGALKHFTFLAGERDDDITAYATYDSGNSTLVTTTSTHELLADQYISIVGTTNYNEIYEVLSIPSTTTFEIDKAWDTNDDGVGTFIRGDSLTANGQSAGDYSGDHYLSSTAATNSDKFESYTIVNGSVCTKCKTKRTYGVGADYGTVAGHALATGFEEGTVIQYGVTNIGGTGNITIQYGNVKLVRQ